MVHKKITHQRMENKMVFWNENKGWTAQNNSPKRWTDEELNGLHENNSPKLQRDGRTGS